MSPLLKDFLNKRIVVVTTEGQCVCATLEGFDKSTNLLVSEVRDRVSGAHIATSYMMRGNQIVCCGLLDETDGSDTALVGPEAPTLKDTKNVVHDEHLIWQRVWASKQKAASPSLE
ncbi:LANO_0E16138g1_1 [Lachancea nothofagi CBS 11611]|uniref:LSM2-LSM8 complex subunit LSM8 n=1 Tax=Lachancea nothofagi CBS 11611 TaxID=1266666 RepID=A0A1G4K1M7_9SACH|nr:LANO_0E16138g1_1 [Lachancea nothofagi CBS 11611]